MVVRRERRKRELLLSQLDIFLKAAELALTSEDSQDLALASTVVRGLHPAPRNSVDGQLTLSPASRSLRSVSASPVKSSAASYLSVESLTGEQPAKRLRSASAPSTSTSPTKPSPASASSAASDHESPYSSSMPSPNPLSVDKHDGPTPRGTPGRRQGLRTPVSSAEPQQEMRSLRSRSECSSSDLPSTPVLVAPAKRRHSSRR